MVRGLDNFKKFFKDHKDQFIIIGGTACSIWMEEAGLSFRTTNDIDMVLVIEAIDKAFTNKFWAYIRAGQYEIKEKDSEKKILYRFAKPRIDSFPKMIEIFSKKPDVLEIPTDQILTPVINENGTASLSAILLKDEYYNLIIQSRKVINEISIAEGLCLIPLKAKAFLDLQEQKNNGENIDSEKIKKHKNDVFRLYFSSTGAESFLIADPIKEDMNNFLSQVVNDQQGFNGICKSMGINNTDINDMIGTIRKIYGI